MEFYNLIAGWVGWPVIVALLLVGGGYAAWLLNNRIESLKEVNDRLTKETNLRIISSETYGIQISSPLANQQVSQSFEVKGIFRELPKGLEIWVSTVWGQGKVIKYWPQERASVLGNTWSSQVDFVDPGTRKVLVFVVGENGQALMHYFKKAGEENSIDGVQRWPAIIELPSDTTLCASVEVNVV